MIYLKVVHLRTVLTPIRKITGHRSDWERNMVSFRQYVWVYLYCLQKPFLGSIDMPCVADCTSMAVNLQRKAAMKRLAQDLQELEQQPVENVSASPLEENMLEWHCNFQHDEMIYHLILFLPEKYPYESPSAEFVPAGFR